MPKKTRMEPVTKNVWPSLGWNFQLYVGGESQLDAKWTITRNPNVGKVNQSGVFMAAKKPGNSWAEIMATSADGSHRARAEVRIIAGTFRHGDPFPVDVFPQPFLSLPFNKGRATGSKTRLGQGSHGAYAAFFTAGWRFAGPERLPLGRPGERPRGFGAAAGVPNTGRSEAKFLRTLVGVSDPEGNGRSHGNLRSATMRLASKSCAYAIRTNHIHRSACSG